LDKNVADGQVSLVMDHSPPIRTLNAMIQLNPGMDVTGKTLAQKAPELSRICFGKILTIVKRINSFMLTYVNSLLKMLVLRLTLRNDMKKERQYFTHKEAANMIGVSYGTLRNYLSSGYIKYPKKGTTLGWQWTQAEIDRARKAVKARKQNKS